MLCVCIMSSMVWVRVSITVNTLGDFTFWIILSLSLFAQSKIRTERKLTKK